MQALQPSPHDMAPMPVREQISSLTDGHAADVDWTVLLDAYADSPQVRECWSAYHVIGAALRQSSEPSVPSSAVFVSAVMERVRTEQPPVLAASLPLATVRSAAANDGVFRWKMLAGMASVVAVVAVAWQMLASPSAPVGSQWAQQSPGLSGFQQVPRPDGSVMLRDAQLDELMAAHRQSGGMSALQVPAGFLRNATYESPQR